MILFVACGSIGLGLFQGSRRNTGVKVLVWYEQYDSREEALVRERRVKKWNRAWKLQLIERQNGSWRDLWDEISS